MYITPISGTRALIPAQHGNKRYSEEINSTRGLFSTLEIIENRMGGGGVGGWTTFDLTNISLIPGVTHVGVQKTTACLRPSILCEVPVCVFLPALL